MTKIEMLELIEATMRLQRLTIDEHNREIKDTEFEPLPHAVAYPPATSEEIKILKNHLKNRGVTLPPSFEMFLSLHNGIEDYVRNLSLQSTQKIINSWDDDKKRIDTSPVYQFIILRSGDMCALAGFLPSKINNQGEMPLLELPEYSVDEPYEHDNFEEFLKEVFSYYRDVAAGLPNQ